MNLTKNVGRKWKRPGYVNALYILKFCIFSVKWSYV